MSKTATKKQPPSDVKVADFIAFHLDSSTKTRNEIAKEAGFDKPNVLSMMRNGTMKVPLAAAPRLAEALGLDPAMFLRRCMQEYMPEILEVIEKTLVGMVISKNERKIIETLRAATKNADPAIEGKEQERAFVQACKEIFNF